MATLSWEKALGGAGELFWREARVADAATRQRRPRHGRAGAPMAYSSG
jgi:hypothetical protein